MKRGPWKGGYRRITAKGTTFIIDRWIGGVHFHKSTRCSTERAADKQLERFEADPFKYTPLGDTRDSLVISAELVAEYGEWMLKTKKNTPLWVSGSLRFLAHWALDLNGKDLRDVSIQRDLKPALDKRKSRKHRIEALKAFCTWLRQEKGLLTKAEDRTLDLPVPQSAAAKTHRRRVVSQEDIERTLPFLPEATQDVVVLQSGTAWHISEVRRFARGEGEIVRPIGGDPLAVLRVLHKSKEMTRVPVRDRQVLEAAERILQRGRILSVEQLVSHMREACDAVRAQQAADGVPEEARMPHWRLGSMRHSVLTKSVELGDSPETASQFANHRSVATTKKFYLDVAVPTVGIRTMQLVRPKSG